MQNNYDRLNPEADLERQSLLNLSRGIVKQQRLTIDSDTPPYKPFNPKLNERCFVQKCFDQQKNPVVIKISNKERGGKKALLREGLIYDMLNELISQVQKDHTISIGFPKKIKMGKVDSGQMVLITQFIEEDAEFKKK